MNTQTKATPTHADVERVMEITADAAIGAGLPGVARESDGTLAVEPHALPALSALASLGAEVTGDPAAAVAAQAFTNLATQAQQD